MVNITKDNTDSIVYSVINKFKSRSDIGLKKYKKTLDRTDLTFLDWLNHTQEELMDAVLYIEKLKNINNDSEFYKDYPIYTGQDIETNNDVFYLTLLGLSICSALSIFF